MERAEALRALYRAFNAREIGTVLAALSPDVRWPNGWEGGWIDGREGVREYWLRQWAAIDPVVEPERIDRRDDGAYAVRVRQVVRSLDGTLLSEGLVTHVYRFAPDGLVTRMDIEEG